MIRVIPCLDIMGGRIVKGVSFEGMRDAGDPVEAVRRYCADGADEIGMLDIRASIENRPNGIKALEPAMRAATVPVMLGGGMATLEIIEAALAAGASKVGIGSAAFRDRGFMGEAAKRFGSERITALIDVKPVDGAWHCTVGGAQTDTGVDMIEWACFVQDAGAGEILLTTMQDGVQTGYDIAATRACADAVGIPVVASGGAGTLEDFYAAVRDGHASAVLAASVFHFGTLRVSDVKAYLRARGL